MHDELYELKDKLLKELGEYSQNGKYSKEDVETVKYISSAVDHLFNICDRMEDEEYSQRGGSGRYSYGNGDMRYPRQDGGSYARGRGQNARRDSMGRYSRAGDSGDIVMELESLMRDAPNEQIKQKMRQLVQEIEQM